MVKEISLDDKLPSFSLEATMVVTCRDSDLLGKWAVVFIYPKDNTSGCTREAREFNERYSEFESAGVRIFGVSKDTLASHTSFSKKLNLQFPLISDPKIQLIQSLNAWKEKSMYGKKYMGAERSTFLINENLTVKYIWRKVKVAGHVDEVFNKYKELTIDL